MKKLIIGLLSIVLGASSVYANGTAPSAAAEGLEISGNVDVVAGYQHDDKDAVGTAQGGMGDVVFGTAANADHFRFIVDQVEIDLAKSFGENIRLRADVDFTDFANTNTRAADVMDLEQGYVTANIAAGNGIEFLIGKFNAPVGIESADRNENWFVSYSDIYRFLVPTQTTGAKIYYAFSDLVDFHWAVVNSLNSTGFAGSAIPSTLFRLGFNWGEEGNESTFGIGGGAGPEQVSQNAHWDFYGDLDALIAVTDTIDIAGEATYRQTDTVVPGLLNQKALAAQLALNYEASDVWDVSFRGGWFWDFNNVAGVPGAGGASTTGGNWGGFEGTTYSGAIATTYQIADGAKMKWEYRFDFDAVSGPASNSDYHSLMAEFAYSF